MKRAIYIGKIIKDRQAFLNYGITGNAHKSGNWWIFEADGQNSPEFIYEEDLYFFHY
jgi:hypothetical protein